jgi:hypothetical protein
MRKGPDYNGAMKPNEQSAITRQHRLFTGQILFLLLILRIPYTIAIIYLLPVENQTGAAIYELASYGLSPF